MAEPGKEDWKNVEELSYEQAVAELESVVSALESDQEDLERALRLFERGRALVAYCSKLLDSAELKVSMLTEGSLDHESDLGKPS
jgi:exodeoxyribonuclease VII small subunit